MSRALLAHTWLILRNDLRVLWRELLSGKRQVFSRVGFIVLIFVLLQGIALLLFTGMRNGPPLAVETLAWFFFAFVMFGAAMNHAIGVLFERADFDLLLSSPIASRAILLARVAALTIGSAATVAIFLSPLLNAAAILSSPRYACGYVVWFLLASTAASAGVWATLLLVRWLGPRRARTWGQVIAGVLGASVYLVMQGPNFLPQEARANVSTKLAQVFDHPALMLPARAGRGDWFALLILIIIATASAALTLRLLSQLFVSGVQEAAGVKPSTRRLGQYVFASGLARATFWKDLRLIARDPLLLSKTLPTALYLLPMVFALGRFGRAGIAAALAPFAVLIALFLSPQLTAVATAGEEGWDMIRMSGASTVRLRIAKIAAGMAIPMALCAALAIATAVLGRPGLALLSLGVALVGTASACWLEVAIIRPTPRRDLIQKPRLGRGASPGRAILTGIQVIVGGACVSLAAHEQWALASVGGGVVTLVALASFTLVPARDPEFGD